jgi:subtilisin family serine protease
MTALVHVILPGTMADSMVAAAAIAATAALLLPPLLAAAFLTRSREGWRETAALAAASAAVGGFLLLDSIVQAVFPVLTAPPLQGEGAAASAIRLTVLLAYVLFAAWLAPVAANAPRRPLGGWLGLNHLKLSPLLLALALAVLVTIPWPVTGALGDSLTSLSLLLRTLALALPQAVLVWGVVFCLLTATFAKPWLAALLSIVLYAPSAYGEMLPGGEFSVLLDGASLVPLAFLLTELRTRRSGIYPLLPIALCYHLAPSLFVDPRDTLAGGIPEGQHILSQTVAWAIALVAGPVLWAVRKLSRGLRERVQVPGWMRACLATLVLFAVCGIWAGLYVTRGRPGFHNDGFLIILDEQADLSAAHGIAVRDTRVQYVYDTLVATADRTQAPLREELDQLGAPYRSYYVMNMIRVDGRRWLAGRFKSRAGVADVILNPNVREYPNRTPIPYADAGTEGETVPPNLAAVHANEAWELGATGEGIVVAGQDTGYDWTHPALRPHYRGWDGQAAHHDYNWHDAWDDAAVPFDDDSHGTHTMGIAVGDDGSRNHIGVAPGAQWIGCRNMRRGVGNPGSYAECMEYFLAPYPHGGDPFVDGDVRMSPHIVNNSWGCPYWEGCSADTLEPAMEALRAAGIMMVVSAGNDGPACGTAAGPPANYEAVFAVGATDDGGNIVSFSSRGPVGRLVKPDITAPGYGVRSSVPGGGYGWAGGTSMAGPHVAGVAALVWSADPTLVGDIDATEDLICQTAVPRPVDNICTIEDKVPEGSLASLFADPVCACGGLTGAPNNVYGCGFIDAGAAVRAAVDE